MPKQNMATFVKNVQTGIKKHDLEIYTAMGIAGMFTATVMAIGATPKALAHIEDKKTELGVDTLDKKDIIKVAAPCYIPAAFVSLVSAACLWGASSKNARRNAALATAYTLSESALKTYRKKVIETIGDKKEQSIREEVAKEKLTNNPVQEVILTERGGNTICYDAYTDRYFKSDRDTINRVVNNLNRQMRDEMYISLNEFYCELGLKPVRMGDILGWNIDNGYIDISYSSLLDENGNPCLVLDYQIAPVYNYQ